MSDYDKIRAQFIRENRERGVKPKMSPHFSASTMNSFETEYMGNRERGETRQQYRERRAKKERQK